MESVLEKIYYNPAHSASYGGVNNLYQSVRNRGISLQEVKHWLRKQPTYTLHKPLRRNFPRNRTHVSGIDHQWQSDLADLSHLRSYNNGYNFLFCVIDVFSKTAWVVPLKTKRGEEMANALQKILKESGRKPLQWQSDKGSEFLNRRFQNELKKRDIHFFTTENTETKASIVERFQRTLKERMWKYFTHKHTYKYIDVISNIVGAYNRSYHRSIGCSPDEVSVKNEVDVYDRLCRSQPDIRSQKEIAVGEWVRISKNKHTFEKGYLPKWTTELFRVTNKVQGRYPPVYKLQDMNGEKLNGTFYLQELQPIVKLDNEVYDIESILERRTRVVGKRRIKEVKVRWKGYPPRFDSWIDAHSLVNYKRT